MPLRVRPTVEQLETRDTPSLPPLDPFGGYAPLPAPQPVAGGPAPAPLEPARVSGFWERVAVEVVGGALLAEHPVYKVPLVLPALPR